MNASKAVTSMDVLESLQVANNIFVGLLMFGIANTCDLDSLRALQKKPHGLLIGSLIQLLLLPFIGWVLIQIISLPPNLAAGLIITSSMPGGSISNILSLVFQFDLALSVAMTTFSSIAALVMIPLNTLLYLSLTGIADSATIDWMGIGMSTSVVVVGTGLGFVAKAFVSDKMSFVFQQIGILAGVVMAITSCLMNAFSNSPLWELPAQTYLAVAILPLVAAATSLGAARACKLELQSAATIMIEASVQNVILALGIIIASIPDRESQVEALGVPLVYGSIGNLVTIILCVVLYKQGWSNADPKRGICSSFLHKHYSCCFEASKQEETKADIEQPNQASLETPTGVAIS